MLVVEFDADPVAPKLLCGNKRRSAPCKRIEHHIDPAAEHVDQGQEGFHGFFGPMELVTGIGKVDNIRNGIVGTCRIALGEEISLFVLIPQKAL